MSGSVSVYIPTLKMYNSYPPPQKFFFQRDIRPQMPKNTTSSCKRDDGSNSMFSFSLCEQSQSNNSHIIIIHQVNPFILIHSPYGKDRGRAEQICELQYVQSEGKR